MNEPFRLPTSGTLENNFARLGEGFFTAMPAERVGETPRLIHANPAAAELLDLDPQVFRDTRFAEVVAGHRPLEGFSPLAMVYSGHQFGVWAGQLGDGDRSGCFSGAIPAASALLCAPPPGSPH